MIKKWNNFINEELGNQKSLDFYDEYARLFTPAETARRAKNGSYVDYDEIGDLIEKHDLSYEEVNQILNTMDTSFDVEGDLQANYDNWVEDGMTKGSGYTEEEDSMKQKIHQAFHDMTKSKYDDNLGTWLDELSDDNLEMLFNILAGSGKIESSY